MICDILGTNNKVDVSSFKLLQPKKRKKKTGLDGDNWIFEFAYNLYAIQSFDSFSILSKKLQKFWVGRT